jgi:hypothetical protein
MPTTPRAASRPLLTMPIRKAGSRIMKKYYVSLAETSENGDHSTHRAWQITKSMFELITQMLAAYPEIESVVSAQQMKMINEYSTKLGIAYLDHETT